MGLLEVIVLAVYAFFFTSILFPKKKEEKKAPEQELGEAISKYLKSVKISKE